MWFFRGKPNIIDIQTVVESLPKGYQRTMYKFRLQAEDSKTKEGTLFVGFPFPWSANKHNGSIVVEDICRITDYYPLQENETIVQLKQDDFQVLEKVRVLKTNQDCELMNIQDFMYWHVEDVGVIVSWLKVNQWYTVSYTHKIAYDSQLFVPTRYPISVSCSNDLKVNHEIYVINGRLTIPPKYLRKVKYDHQGDYYVFENWNWDEDTRFPTNNWDSSDDDDSDSDNEDTGDNGDTGKQEV